MSYITYTTEALVCGGFEQNTADKSFLLFTKEAGMLFAVAKSVREESSKQRQALADFSRIRVSLVKGKTGWRIGSVEAVGNDFALANDRLERYTVVSVYRTLRRFVRGEEAAPELYDFVLSALDVALLPMPNRLVFDRYVQVMILARLGYVSEENIPKSLQNVSLGEVAAWPSVDEAIRLEAIIAKATESSHL